LIAYAALTLLVFLPLLPQLQTAGLVEPADLATTARDYWAAEELGSSVFALERDTLVYAPEGVERSPAIQIANFVQPAFVLLTQHAVGYVGALNLYMLLGFTLTAWVTFLLLSRLRLHVVASFIGGLVFGLSWWQLEQAIYGHVGLNQLWVLPLVLLALLFMRRRRDVASAALAGGVLALSFYVFSYLGLIALALIGVFGLADLTSTRNFRRAATGYAVVTVVALGLLFPALAAPTLFPSGFTSAFPAGKSEFFGAALTDYLIPSSRHPILGSFGTWLSGGPHGGENALCFGWTALGLAAAAAIWRGCRSGRGGSEDDERAVVLRCALLLLPVGILLSLPAYAEIAGRRVPIPDAAYAIGTFVNWWKVYSRFGVLFGLGVTILAAYTLHLILTHRKRYAGVGWALCALILLELAPDIRGKVVTLRDPDPLVAWLAAQPHGIVAHYPMQLDWRSAGSQTFDTYAWRSLYDQTRHGQPMYAPPSLRSDGTRREALRLLASDLREDLAVRILRTQDVRYVVVHDDVYRDLGQPPLEPARGLVLRQRISGARIYSVEAEPLGSLERVLADEAERVAAERGLGQLPIEIERGANAPEQYGRSFTARWLTQNAVVEVDGPDLTYPARWQLLLRGFSNGAPRTLELRDSDGDLLGRALFGTSETTRRIGPFSLEGGRTRLTLVARPGPTPLGGSDSRRGSVFLFEFRALPLAY
jgi:hypothetical protein